MLDKRQNSGLSGGGVDEAVGTSWERAAGPDLYLDRGSGSPHTLRVWNSLNISLKICVFRCT